MERKKFVVNINIFLMIIVMTLIAVDVIFINRHSTMGDELTQISEKINNLKKENEIIGQKIASSSSMAMVSQRAKSQGLSSSPKIVSFVSSLPFAANLNSSL